MKAACAIRRTTGGQERRLPGIYGASMRSVTATREIRTVSMKASNALTPMAQRTSQRMSPKVVATMTPMRRGTLAHAVGWCGGGSDGVPRGALWRPVAFADCLRGQRRGHLADHLAHRGGRIGRLARRAHEPASDDDAVRPGRGGLRSVLGRRDPEAERHRHGGV